ncbi:MAG: DUF427 domain-containing protein [Alphaproteobacteria bacterium]
MPRPTPQVPEPGQESVWDYPRPPRLEPVRERVTVEFAGALVAESQSAFRVLETSHPPVYYLPPTDIRTGFMLAASGHSYCEFKGMACYWTLEANGLRSERAAWSYPNPTRRFQQIADFFAFYPSRVDRCRVGEHVVRAQPGDFYGGWITDRIVGPFKGSPGTLGW